MNDEDDDYSEFNEGGREAGPSRRIEASASSASGSRIEAYDSRAYYDEPQVEIPPQGEGSDLPVTHEIVMKDHSKVGASLFSFIDVGS